MTKIVDFIKTAYARVTQWSNVYFNFVGAHPKAATALWAVGTFLIWRMIPGVCR